MSIITVNNLSKKYKRYNSKLDRLKEWILPNKKSFHTENWVLRGLSFNVEPGESIGFIGHNGAGKSTLLKILTGTTHPSTGEVHIQGKISALLELGMGFHPDFTGRQNVYMSGQLMGLDNKQITDLLPEIEAFAEIGTYIDQPLRTYSSGMMVRLAFSVATSVRPDILIVDEALSVGDAYFQHKSFDRIKKFREAGTTLLFVSHDPGAVKNLCDRAILLDQGLMIKDGKPEEVLDYYNAIIAKREADYEISLNKSVGERVSIRSGNGTARIDNVGIYQNGNKINAVQVGEKIDVLVDIVCLEEVDNPTIGILFKDRLGNEIYGTNTFHQGLMLGACKPNIKKTIQFKLPANLGIGHYSLTVAIHKQDSHVQGNYDWWEHAATLQVVPGQQPLFVGVNYLPTNCLVKDTKLAQEV